MKNLVSAKLALLVAFVFAGCLETEREFVLNPDGRGKVTVEATIARLDKMFVIEDGTKKNPKEELDKYIADIIEGSEGIELWSDVSYKDMPDDKVHFRGTAYFRDVNQLKFKNLSNSAFELERLSNGKSVLTLKEESNEDDIADAPALELTEAEITAKADSLRQSYQAGRAMMEPMLKEMRDRSVFRLPGTIEELQGFQRPPSGGGAVIEVEGEKILRIMDSLAALDSFWRDQAASGGKDVSRDAMFGGVQPKVVFAPGGTALFNYDKEVGAARKKYAALKKKLKIQ